MRVLVSAFPAVGHLHPVLPLATALRREGHPVAVLTASSMREHVPAGCETLPVGIGLEEMLGRHGTRAEDPPRSLTEAIGRFFSAVRLTLDGDEALEIAGRWEPDLVVAEGLDVLGPLVATARGLPCVRVGLGPVCSAEVIEAMDAGAAPYYQARGLTVPTAHPWFDPWPEPLRPVDWSPPARTSPMRPVGVGTGRAVALPPASADRPTVLLTMGTVFDSVENLRALVDAHLERGFALLVALGPRSDPALLRVEEERVRVLPFTPLDTVLPQVDVVACHGGAGTVLATLAHGLPLVLAPQGADHDLTAAGVARAGAGVVLEREVPAAAVAEATGAAVDDAGIRAGARRIGEHIADMPAPEDIVRELKHVVPSD